MVATAGTPRARALSAALRDARKSSGIGVRELARQLSMSHTRISHWETGHRVPNVEVVAMMLAAMRVSPGEREKILDLARNVGEPNWLTVGMSGIPQQLAGAVECERAATAIVEWTPMVIPGLLQTSEYCRSLMESNALPQSDIELRVMVRVGRGQVLSCNDPVNFEALISEAVLYEPVGGPRVMADQLRYILELSQRPNLLIRVVPLRVGWHPGWSGPFVFYEFPDASPVIHFEHYSSGAFVPTEHDVEEYRNALKMIRGMAMSDKETLNVIEKSTQEWESVA